jgi:hypothetical protein
MKPFINLLAESGAVLTDLLRMRGIVPKCFRVYLFFKFFKL